MDDVIELLLELILDGMLEAAGSKRVPLPVRIALTALLALFALGIFGLLLWISISCESIPAVIIVAACFVGFLIGVFFKVKKYRNTKQ